MDTPNDASSEEHPPGLVWLAGGEVDGATITLRFFDDDLEPEAISSLLSASPTSAWRKGDPFRRGVIRKQGSWQLSCETSSRTIEEQITLLLEELPSDLSKWKAISARSKELWCRLRLQRWNRGAVLSPVTLQAIADRGLALFLDIYCPSEGSA